MKIVQAVETAGPGGAERVLIDLSTSLRDAGHEVRVLLLRDGWLGERLRERGISVHVLPLRKPLDRGFLHQLRSMLTSLETELLHTHEFTFGLYGRAATRNLRLPHVATAHGANFARGFKRRALGALTLRRRPRFRLVAVSRTLAGRLAGRLGMPSSAIDVVPNGVPLRPSTVNRRVEGEPLRLLAVGNLYPVKNHGLLVRAVAELRRSGVPAELDILGRGQDERSLREQIEALELTDTVRLQGYRDDVVAFLARAHVFVSASLSEGMPLSYLEAMGAGLPVVGSRVGGVPEIVEHERGGLLFASEDLTALTGALRRLAADEGLRQRLAEHASIRAQEAFSVHRMVERYEGIYASLRR